MRKVGLMTFLFYICAVFFSCSSNSALKTNIDDEESASTYLLEPVVKKGELGSAVKKTSFAEIWAYLTSGNENYLDNNYPITDLAYFGAEVNTYGELIGVPNLNKISGFPGRKHLVVICNSTSLTHFCIDSKGWVRKELIDSLVEATQPFDGLQIDFELVPKRDVDEFFSFLKELRMRLPEKIFTVALPARTRTIENDVYDYERISGVVDKIFVMAYDEHWSTSAPGPVASLDWCDRIASYRISVIGKEKLVMGLPFYGRTWGNVSLNRAFYFSGIQRIMRENNVKEVHREQGIPTFTYEVPDVTVTGYYDDVFSLSERLSRYSSMGICGVGFWTLGQEDPRVWGCISVEQSSVGEDILIDKSLE